jgi:hypothetical protein
MSDEDKTMRKVVVLAAAIAVFVAAFAVWLARSV